jgi:hypothetical protein
LPLHGPIGDALMALEQDQDLVEDVVEVHTRPSRASRGVSER